MATNTRNSTNTKVVNGKKRTTTAKKSASIKNVEPDSTFFLKLVVFLILGSQWVYIESYPDWQLPIPVGLILGLVFATHEHFQIDRKIEYAVLLVATFAAFWLPVGLIIQL
jgi:hypothetical protein